ncbi:hypothetical protein GOODEAATRI_033655 [Goodea atripinnis]|uniref:Uncharacterized protein n=1 Tax=Goodea atripinnis TaxID=208336 RepID=A0ABV0Q359_9TELE
MDVWVYHPQLLENCGERPFLVWWLSRSKKPEFYLMYLLKEKNLGPLVWLLIPNLQFSHGSLAYLYEHLLPVHRYTHLACSLAPLLQPPTQKSSQIPEEKLTSFQDNTGF